MPAPKIDIMDAASVESVGKQLSMTPTKPNNKALFILPSAGQVLSRLKPPVYAFPILIEIMASKPLNVINSPTNEVVVTSLSTTNGFVE